MRWLKRLHEEDMMLTYLVDFISNDDFDDGAGDISLKFTVPPWKGIK